MRLTVRTPRMGWSAVIDVPDKCLVGELRKTAAQAADVPPARARLILRGATLEVRPTRRSRSLARARSGAHIHHRRARVADDATRALSSPSRPQDDSRIAPIKPDDTVLVALAPEPVNRGGRAGGTRDDDDDDDDDDDAVRFPFGRLDRARTSRTRLRLLRFLQHRVKLPEALAHGILRVRLRTYAGVVVWLTLCRASWRCAGANNSFFSSVSSFVRRSGRRKEKSARRLTGSSPRRRNSVQVRPRAAVSLSDRVLPRVRRARDEKARRGERVLAVQRKLPRVAGKLQRRRRRQSQPRRGVLTRRVLLALVPIRPRSSGARRSVRPFAGEREKWKRCRQ